MDYKNLLYSILFAVLSVGTIKSINGGEKEEMKILFFINLTLILEHLKTVLL